MLRSLFSSLLPSPMDVPQQARGRSSSSAGDKNPGTTNQSPYPDNVASLSLDPAASANNLSQPLFVSSNPGTGATESYPINPSLISASTTQDSGNNNLLHAHLQPDSSFDPQQQYTQFEESFLQQLEQSSNMKPDDGQFPNFMPSDQVNYEDFSTYPNGNTAPDYGSPLGLDSQPSQSSPYLNQSINPADLSRMSSPHNPTPPHLAPPEAHSSPRPTSPASSPGTYYTPQHSRHASLDPATAANVSGHLQTDWKGMLGNPSFHGHRRAPSEHSDVSSVAHSPYLGHYESFDTTDNHSPLLAPENDPGLVDALGIGSFTISDHGLSPVGTPYNVSPRLVPQHQGVDLGPDNSFFLPQQVNAQLASPPADTYAPQTEVPDYNYPPQTSSNDMGQAAQMVAPVISVELAPPSKNSAFETMKPGTDGDTLSPPMNRSRGRSKSDPFAHPLPRQMPPSGLNAPAPQPSQPSHDPRSLSPHSYGSGNLSTPSSRNSSPARVRRLSTSSIDSRKILDLAAPDRAGSNGVRTQKHPATFQCTLCPKRFTRAYNLRSHLRTHTDERPFVCTVCGKAFARQHDRKRHEALHSGEKKFVCRGDLIHGGHWGCGRKFARADALGRHFRSEAGRVCIKPLLDEEAKERERAFMSQQEQGASHLQPVPQPITIQGMDGHPGGFTLPAALLTQYPALQNLQWDQLAAQTEDNSDFRGGGRSSFDASSGGEFGFGDDDDSGFNSGYISGPGPSISAPPPEQQHMLGVGPPGQPGGWPQGGQQWTDYNVIK